MRLILKG